MLAYTNDELYENAARNPEDFDKLLRQVRKTRAVFILALLGIILLSFAAMAWVLYQIFQMMDSPNLEMPPGLKYLSSLGQSNLPFLVIVILSAISSMLAGAMAADGRIKSLILFRALRDAAAPSQPLPANG